MKKNIGTNLALYPTPLAVVGTIVNGKPNYVLVGHLGIIGHDRIMVSLSKTHYSNKGIKESHALTVNLVNEAMLPKADYTGCVSGSTTDKSEVFAYHTAETGAPILDESPVVMECLVDDIYETKGFESFICKIAAVYAEKSVLNENGKIDYAKLKPVLFEMPNYQYLRTGDVIGSCMKLHHSK
ncbi:MAG: flavin reductase family protein [Acutalibacteraceae bacterium]